MTTPTLRDLQPGRLVYIPSGAALTRPRPRTLALIVSEAAPSSGIPGVAVLHGQVLRADGSNPSAYRTTTITATLDQLTIAPPGIRRCVATGCPASYDAIAMYGGEPIDPGWRMLQRGVLGGTDLCPRHAPIVVAPDGTFRHAPTGMERGTGTITCTCGALLHPRTARKNAPVTRAACVLAYGVHIAAITTDQKDQP